MNFHKIMRKNNFTLPGTISPRALKIAIIIRQNWWEDYKINNETYVNIDNGKIQSNMNPQLNIEIQN